MFACPIPSCSPWLVRSIRLPKLLRLRNGHLFVLSPTVLSRELTTADRPIIRQLCSRVSRCQYLEPHSKEHPRRTCLDNEKGPDTVLSLPTAANCPPLVAPGSKEEETTLSMISRESTFTTRVRVYRLCSDGADQNETFSLPKTARQFPSPTQNPSNSRHAGATLGSRRVTLSHAELRSVTLHRMTPLIRWAKLAVYDVLRFNGLI